MSSSRAWIGRLRRGLPWCLALGVWWAPAVWADYQESYRDGIGAVDRQNWAEVARFMQAAINQNPRAGEKVRLYGVRFEVYLPYYYLGLAQYHLDNHRAAVTAWDVSESQGAVRGKQLRDLRAKREECRHLSVPEPTSEAEAKALAEALSRAGEMLDSAEAAANEISELEQDPDFSAVFTQTSDLAEQKANAMDRLGLAQVRFAAGKEAGDRAAIEEAQTLATEAESGFRSVLSQALARRDQMEEARRAEQRTPQEPVTPSEPSEPTPPVPVVPPSAEPGPPDQRLPIDQRPADEQVLREGISVPERVEPTTVVPAGPPPDLRSAAEAFFKADYQTTLAILAAAGFRQPKTQAVSYLLSAAARYALFLEGGRQDESQRATAATDVAACRQLDPTVRPDPALFSPAFTRFFEAPQ